MKNVNFLLYSKKESRPSIMIAGTLIKTALQRENCLSIKPLQEQQQARSLQQQLQEP